MIQRIQTLYLLCAVIVLVLAIMLPIGNFLVNDEEGGLIVQDHEEGVGGGDVEVGGQKGFYTGQLGCELVVRLDKAPAGTVIDDPLHLLQIRGAEDEPPIRRRLVDVSDHCRGLPGPHDGVHYVYGITQNILLFLLAGQAGCFLDRRRWGRGKEQNVPYPPHRGKPLGEW